MIFFGRTDFQMIRITEFSTNIIADIGFGWDIRFLIKIIYLNQRKSGLVNITLIRIKLRSGFSKTHYLRDPEVEKFDGVELSKYMCIYIYIYTYICVYVYIHIYIHIY